MLVYPIPPPNASGDCGELKLCARLGCECAVCRTAAWKAAVPVSPPPALRTGMNMGITSVFFRQDHYHPIGA